MSKMTRAEFVPDARSRIWTRTLGGLLPNPEVRAFFLRCLGASLSGHPLKQFVYKGPMRAPVVSFADSSLTTAGPRTV
jgi:hypothetical protein